MSTTEFSIVNAVRGAYGFVWQEWKYLLRLSLLPAGIGVGTQLFLFAQGDVSAFEAYIWGAPASALLGWFMFQETRLLLLGERPENIPPSPDYVAARSRALQASITIWLLFSMGWWTLLGYNQWAFTLKDTQEFWPVGLGALLFGLFFWGLRFGVAHILAAVEFPIARYVMIVNGLGISFRLFAMGLLCSAPVVLIFGLLTTLVAPDMGMKTTPQGLVMEITPLGIVLDSLMTFLICTLLNAAGAFAMKDILGSRGRTA